eukprot:scaffold94877_cov61-Phaeocystis_antarctica.AAC.2
MLATVPTSLSSRRGPILALLGHPGLLVFLRLYLDSVRILRGRRRPFLLCGLRCGSCTDPRGSGPARSRGRRTAASAWPHLVARP